MTGTETIREKIRKITEDIDTVTITDPEAWQRIQDSLHQAVADIPEAQRDAISLGERCLEGIQCLVERRVQDAFALIEGLYDGLTVLEQSLDEKVENASLMEAACQTLDEMLPNREDRSAEASAAVPPPDPVAKDVSMDDAAALLVQLEPDDTDELNHLRGMLEELADNRDFPPEVCRLVAQAAETVIAIIDDDALDVDAALDQVGQQIEAAMTVFNDPAGAGKVTVPVTKPPQAVASGVPDSVTPETASRSDASKTQVTGAISGLAQLASIQVTEDSPDPTNYLPEDADLEMLSEFIAEGNDLIANAEEALLTLETDPDDQEAVGTVFRAFHTVKGTAAFLDVHLISELGHHAETLLSRVRDKEIRYCGGYADLSLRALDMIKELIRRVEGAVEGKSLLKPAGYDTLMEVLTDPEAAGVSEEIEEPSNMRIGDILVAQGKVSRDEVEAIAVASKESGKPLGLEIVKAEKISTEEVAKALRTQSKLSGPKRVESTVRVSTERLDRLIEMVGELVIAHSMVAQDELVVNGANHDLVKRVSHTSKIVRELQDMSMSLRMVPLKATFNKMARLVRDLSRKMGKNVNFVTEGEDTEIDRNLVDVINDPLVHLVRNAVDHGIESPDTRESSGKPLQGTVGLAAYHSAGSVVVEIKDDGKGLDRDVILAKAVEKGLVNEGSNLSDREIFNMIFEPGFSTAQVVTDVSGRGVGMDVVRKNIESLRGEIEIESEKGNGSVIKMSLPLTLAIIDGMVVRVREEIYVIPTVSIIRSVKPDPNDISTVLKQGEMMRLQGELIPLFRVASLYHLGNGNGEAPGDTLVVVVEDKGNQAGLIIDELVGRQQVVIKSLGEAMRDIPGIAGGAIMPNGRVGLILDVGGLVKYAHAGSKDSAGFGFRQFPGSIGELQASAN